MALACYGLGEFIISLVAQPIINWQGSRTLILILCAVPTFICGLFMSYVVESPRYVYGSSKVKALNLLNMIA